MRIRVALTSILAALAIAFVAIPSGAFAATVSFPYYGGLAGGEPLLPCTGFLKIESKDSAGAITSFSAVSSAALYGREPCQSLCDVFELANRVLIFGLSVLITIFLPIMILIGGFYVLTSGGTPSRRAEGFKIIRGTMLGLALTVGAFFIVNQSLLLLFKEGYGKAMQDALRTQIQNDPSLGLTEKDIPEFSWNSISCTLPYNGQIKIAPVTPTPPGQTPPIISTNPTPPTTGADCLSAGGTCMSTTATPNPEGFKCAGLTKKNSCPQKYPTCCIPDPNHACTSTCKNLKRTWSGVVNKNGDCACSLKQSP